MYGTRDRDASSGAVLHGEPAAAADLTAQSSTPAQNLAFGKQQYGRAAHGKGVIMRGHFLPSPGAATSSTSPHFQKVAVPVTVRFSDFAGTPTVSDTDALANPRVLALRFHLRDGSETDLVTYSFDGLPAAAAGEVRRFLIALGTGGRGAAATTPADAHPATDQIAKVFLESRQPPPFSYATLSYHSVASFKFSNARGRVGVGRYRIEPAAGIRFLSVEARAKAAPGYLADELRRRVAREPVRFVVRIQLAGPADEIDEPSSDGPESRQTLELGFLELAAVVPNCAAAQRSCAYASVTDREPSMGRYEPR